MRKIFMRKWFWIFLGVVTIVIWRIVVNSNKPIKVETAKVVGGDLVQSVSTSGTVKADQYAPLTFQGGGLVAWVGVKAGDVVKKGQAIAQLEAILLNAAYQQALNNYRNYQAIAENVLDSVKGNDTTETFTQKATRTTAEVNRDNAYNSVLSARDNLKNATIYAPFAGVIDSIVPASAGINVLPGAANYTIVNPQTVYFDAEVEETDLPNVKVGQTVNIRLDAYPDSLYQGKVEVIGMVAFTSRTGGNAYHIRISLPNNIDQKFKVGMGGDTDIIYNTILQVLKVPSSAVVTDTSNYVWVAENGRAKKVKVETGASSIDETEIKSGLKEGQIVTSQSSALLKEGSRVQF
ncbi:MAG: Efflux transporter, RND family, MFP subunit [Candidatus Woesebacteria bacterium GW2011_GWA2_40_7]|uniref:Efflux transporter, RND family, MFP subunit n=3 Tax=Candidatus Woeseibacteriota TaxID=1752722 RepID=A0A0G0LLS4_9BACT|nr:MAG: Efflux transporter, RND family, MFP subunit [Candidatus Woesebacteria bacterium GW2011_GWB1_39_10]KKR73807.1 MAG: Efflux transporter, RND family, MFP subunit [Candidatus Woesebacteria bacterium GW2011_GWA2_40_7]KKS90952.1 MAG: Efflux transporter, RND family, MFP subunit [Candidatus Woesebacteria bacterium GW2011_GWA1_43_12]